MEVLNTYYINLDRSKDRQKNFLKEHENFEKLLNIRLHRVSAYDGRELSLYNDIFIEPGNNNINFYEFACSVSHIKAMIQSYHNNDKHCIIIEDDIIPTYYNNWGCKLQDIIKNKPSDADCIQLTCNDQYQVDRLIKMKHKYEKWSSCFVSTGCYYITRNGMKKIIQKFYNSMTKHITLPSINYKADCHIIYPNVKSYIYTKPTFTWMSSSSYTSTIHSSHDLAHDKCLLYIEKYFKDRNTFIHNLQTNKTKIILKKKI
jgi:GR25 family glycosyltransferase involved in LPS biosynthesis